MEDFPVTTMDPMHPWCGLVLALTWLLVGTPHHGSGRNAAIATSIAYDRSTEARYLFESSDVFTFETDAGPIVFTSGIRAQVDADLLITDALSEARMRFVEVNGEHSNVASGVATVIQTSDISGIAVMAMSSKGVSHIAAKTHASPSMRRLGQPEDYLRRLLPPVPGRRIALGEEWEDTLRWLEIAEADTVESEFIINGSYSADSTIAGRPVAVISATVRKLVWSTRVNAGEPTRRRLTGDFRVTVLWDPSLGRAVRLREEGSLEGFYQVGDTQGMPVRVRSTFQMRDIAM